jgi:predicted amidohydrolase
MARMFRIALANLAYPGTPDAAVAHATAAIADAGRAGAQLVCFPECYVPGYRGLGHAPPPPDELFLERAWRAVADAARAARVAVVLGTERVVTNGGVAATALAIDASGERLGFQDKVQLDPSEDDTYTPGAERRVFRTGELTFGVVICHEGWRYPETVRSAVRGGAQVVFHPHLTEPEPGSFRPTTFGDPANTFHEHAIRCRAAENTCFFASVNYAVAGSGTTSAVADPDGTVIAYQPYGEAGLLVADLELSRATGRLAARLRA